MNEWLKFVQFVLVIICVILLVQSNCARGETRVLYERSKDKIGWDGMPIKEKKKKDERLNKGWHFLTASGLVLLATIGDVESTFHNIKHHGAKEGNPWAESWFKKGKPTAYAYALGVSGATMFGGWLVFRSKDPETQKYWIVFPTIAIIGHGIGIGLNLSF